VGHQDYFLVPLPGSIALFVSSLGIHIVRCNPFIMGKCNSPLFGTAHLAQVMLYLGGTKTFK
jgi:hypothetical protein